MTSPQGALVLDINRAPMLALLVGSIMVEWGQIMPTEDAGNPPLWLPTSPRY